MLKGAFFGMLSPYNEMCSSSDVAWFVSSVTKTIRGVSGLVTTIKDRFPYRSSDRPDILLRVL